MNNILAEISDKTQTGFIYDRNTDSFRQRVNYRFDITPCAAYLYALRKPVQTFAERKRVDVIKFSRSASFRMCRYLRRAETDYISFGTLTYHLSWPDGKGCKKQLATLIKRIWRNFDVHQKDSKQYARDGKLFSLFWFLEFQERGAPHFHFYCSHRIDQRWLRSAWAEIKAETNRSAIIHGAKMKKITGGQVGGVRYARKYAAKAIQKEVPENFKNVGRFWGVAGTNSVSADTLDIINNGAGLDETQAALIDEFVKHVGESRLKRYEVTTKEGLVCCVVWQMINDNNAYRFKQWIRYRERLKLT